MANGDSEEILRNHLLALDRERSAAKVAREEAEKVLTELNHQKDGTIAKLLSSDMYLSRIESRLEAIFESLSKDQSRNAFQLVGESLGNIRLMRRKLRTEEELLAEKGMRRVPESYSFYVGESVVIIAEGEFKGYNAVVKAVDSGGTVIVVPTLDLFSTDEEDSPFLELKRSEVAIWDYPNEFGEKNTQEFSFSKASRVGSNNKVLSLLSSLNDDSNKAPKYKAEHDKASDSFRSSRQRKAAKKGKKKNT
jgi:transcription antitermination factor NusG